MKNRLIIYQRKIRNFINELVIGLSHPKNYLVNFSINKNYKNILKRNIKLKDKYFGKKCFIIGNGSSLNKMDLRCLKDEYTFVVNNFIVHRDIPLIKPKFYVSVEPMLALSKFDNEYKPENYFRRIDRSFSKTNITLFFRVDSESTIRSQRLFHKKDVHYVNGGLPTLLAEKFGYESDITKPISFCDSVIPASICIAAYMGFRDIYLIGCDADYFFKKNNFHFYKDKKSMMQKTWENSSLEKKAHKFSLNLKSWRLLNEYYEDKGINIFNAGIGSKLDMFPVVRYEDLIKSNKFVNNQ